MRIDAKHVFTIIIYNSHGCPAIPVQKNLIQQSQLQPTKWMPILLNKTTCIVCQVNRKWGYTSIDVSYIDLTQGSYLSMPLCGVYFACLILPAQSHGLPSCMWAFHVDKGWCSLLVEATAFIWSQRLVFFVILPPQRDERANKAVGMGI